MEMGTLYIHYRLLFIWSHADARPLYGQQLHPAPLAPPATTRIHSINAYRRTDAVVQKQRVDTMPARGMHLRVVHSFPHTPRVGEGTVDYPIPY